MSSFTVSTTLCFSVKHIPILLKPDVTYTWQLKWNNKCYLIPHHKHYACVNSPHTHTYFNRYIPQKCPFLFCFIYFFLYLSLFLSQYFNSHWISPKRYAAYCKYTLHILTTKFTTNRRSGCILVVNWKRRTLVSGEWNRERALKREGGRREEE